MSAPLSAAASNGVVATRRAHLLHALRMALAETAHIMNLFFIQGVLIEMPATSIMFHLESLGYSITHIALIDAAINVGWLFLWVFRPRWTIPVQGPFLFGPG